MTDKTTSTYDGLDRLAAAFFIDTCQQAKRGDHESLAWLHDCGEIYAQALGLRPGTLTRWLQAGCRRPYNTDKHAKRIPPGHGKTSKTPGPRA